MEQPLTADMKPEENITSSLDSKKELANFQIRVRFVSRQEKYAVTETAILVPTKLKRYGLSEVVNHLLGREQPIPFDFLIDGAFLRTSLNTYLEENGLSSENLLTIEFLESMLPPTPKAGLKHDDWVSCIQGHRNIGLFLTGSYDNVVRIWNAMGECATIAAGHTGTVKDVAWLGNSEADFFKFLSVGQDHRVLAWKAECDGTGSTQSEASILYEGVGHTGSVESISVNNRQFATASADATIKIWSTELGEDETEMTATHENKRRKTKDESRPKKTSLATLSGHVGPVSAVAYNKKTGGLYSGGWDHSVRVWDVETKTNVTTKNCEKVIQALDYSEKAGLIATGHSDHILRLWDPRADDASILKLSLSAHKNWISSVSWSPHNAYTLATGSYDGSLKIWDIRARTPLYNVFEPSTADKESGHIKKVFAVNWTKDFILSGGESSELGIHTASGYTTSTTLE